MKYLAALAACLIPCVSLAAQNPPVGTQITYDCNITDLCKSGGCSPMPNPYKVSMQRIEGESKGTLVNKDGTHEAMAFPGEGTQEFLLIQGTKTLGYTINNDSGEVQIRETGGNAHQERGSCVITQ